jgi:hypothetical protein
MRRRTLLLAAGLLAYYFGATVRVYLRPEGELSSYCGGVEHRILAIVEHPRVALDHPLLAAEFLVSPNCSD